MLERIKSVLISSQTDMMKNEYPVKYRESAYFSFFWSKVACVGFLLYYSNEMIIRIIYFSPSMEFPDYIKTWETINTVGLALVFLVFSFQAVSWRENFLAIENKTKSRNAFFALVLSGSFIAIYQFLVLSMPLQQSYQSDYTIPFLLMILTHFWGIRLVRHIMHVIGRMKKVTTGKSIFYTIFALNPAIRYLAQFLLFVFTSLASINPYLFIFYSELIMTYIASVITIVFIIFFLKDIRKIKIGHQLEVLELEINQQAKEDQEDKTKKLEAKLQAMEEKPN